MGDHVLVPFDGSDQARGALAYALETFPEADIRVVHVVEPFASHTEAGSERVTGSWRDRASGRAEDVLREAVDIAGAYDRDVETDWEYGRPGHVIVGLLEEGSADQVVMGSHGRSGLDRVLLGSVAETVMRRSSVPVTVVP